MDSIERGLQCILGRLDEIGARLDAIEKRIETLEEKPAAIEWPNIPQLPYYPPAQPYQPIQPWHPQPVIPWQGPIWVGDDSTTGTKITLSDVSVYSSLNMLPGDYGISCP